MLLNGDWQIPFISQQAKFEWGVTYMPRNTAMASDFGGNALAVTRDTKNRDAAIDFLKFMAAEEAMKTFVSAAQFLPVRSSLNVPGALNYALRPDAMQVFVEQAKTIPEQLVKTVLLPTWSRINLKLADELDLAFTAGQAADVTAKNIEGHLASILAG